MDRSARKGRNMFAELGKQTGVIEMDSLNPEQKRPRGVSSSRCYQAESPARSKLFSAPATSTRYSLLGLTAGRLIGTMLFFCPPGTGKARVVVAARRKFSPEFVNRIDKVVVFRSFKGQYIRKILESDTHLC